MLPDRVGPTVAAASSQTGAAALSHAERTRIIIGVLASLGLAALDQTIVAPALPSIGKALGHSLWLSWVVAAYLLASTAVMPLCGKLADLRGRRPVLYAAIAVFVVGSLVCATAGSMGTLIVGRAIQGVGGGGLVAAAQTIIGDVAPGRERARYTVYISGLWGASSVAGPVLGGLLAQHVHWSMIFWINLPLGVLAYAMSSRALKSLPHVRSDHRLDLIGAALVVSATMLFLLALTWAGSVLPWRSWTTAGLIGGSLLLFSLFVWHQHFPEEPLLPPRVFADPVIALACAAAFFAISCPIGLSVYFPIYLQMVHGFDAAGSGAALMVLMGAGVLGSACSGFWMRHSVHYRRSALAGSLLSAGAFTVLGLSASRAPFALAETLIGLAGFGFGTQFPVVLVSAQNAAERRDLGVATSAIGFLRALGSVVGLAVFNAIAGSTGLTQAMALASGLPRGAAGDHAGGFHGLFLAAGCAQLAAFVCLLRMEERPLRMDPASGMSEA